MGISSKRELENNKIWKAIIDIHKASKYRYGAHKIHASLKSNGITISMKKIQRLVKKIGVRSVIVKKYRTTSSKHKIVEQENVLKRDFETKNINEK